MSSSQPVSFSLMLLSALAGGIHALAPDHWVPASILCWQRRWRAPQSLLFFSAAMAVHLFLGAALYFALDDLLRAVGPGSLMAFSLSLVLLVMGLRAFRYSRIRDVQRLGPNTWWGALAVLSLLGPCESIIPIFIKSSSLGLGYLLPLAAFYAGSVAVGFAMVIGGRYVCDRPLWMTRVFTQLSQRMAVLPVAAGVALGLRYLIRLG